MILTQTATIFVDAYRELNARKMFWITLGLSLLVVVSFAMVGINEKGLTILWWSIAVPGQNTTVMDAATFYKLMFTTLGVRVWLTWIATILALISTASIIPDMISAGSIELVLARPISRVRLFLTKYLAGLLFVFLQVLVFTGASFLVIGLRGGVWEPGLLLAVPIVTVFFSYLFGACVLFGMVTRSAIASLLMTLLLWFFTFAIHSTEVLLLTFKTKTEVTVERYEASLADTRAKVLDLRAGAEGATDESDAAKLARRIAAGEAYIVRLEGDLPDHQRMQRSLAKWQGLMFNIKTALPKTSETTELLNRWLVELADLPASGDTPAAEVDPDLAALMGGTSEEHPGEAPRTPRSVQVKDDDPEWVRRIQERIRERSVAWVLGTSLGFEFVCVGIAAIIFVRRDF